MNKVKQIHSLGQSIWLDFLNREIMNNGKLQQLRDEDGVCGVTSNPAIFAKAINGSQDYDADIAAFSKEKNSNDDIFFSLAIKDIQQATDIFQPVFEKTKGGDGFVSLEVNPHLATDTEGTIAQAKELWKAVGRDNVMIKIPGTKEGLPAIRQCISEGININITLLFGLPRYKEVTDAYLSGLEDRVKAGQPIDHIASVASFFLSRIDVLVDPQLEEKGRKDLKGEVAIASAKKAYQIYKEVFSSERFKALAEKGAQKQRVLWASTSTKNPDYSDVKYVEALIGENTINTLPLETIDAFRDHGNAESRLEEGLDHADKVLADLKAAGIDIDQVTQQLVEEGIEKFNQPYDKLMEAIEQQKKQTVA